MERKVQPGNDTFSFTHSPLGKNYFYGSQQNAKRLEIVVELMKYLVSTNSLQLPSSYVQSVETRQTPIKITLNVETNDVTQPHARAWEDIYYSQASEESRAGTQAGLRIAWVAWEGVGARDPGCYCGEGGNLWAVSPACPDVGQKETQEVGLESCWQSNSINGVRLFIAPGNELFHYFSWLLLLIQFQKHS